MFLFLNKTAIPSLCTFRAKFVFLASMIFFGTPDDFYAELPYIPVVSQNECCLDIVIIPPRKLISSQCICVMFNRLYSVHSPCIWHEMESPIVVFNFMVSRLHRVGIMVSNRKTHQNAITKTAGPVF